MSSNKQKCSSDVVKRITKKKKKTQNENIKIKWKNVCLIQVLKLFNDILNLERFRWMYLGTGFSVLPSYYVYFFLYLNILFINSKKSFNFQLLEWFLITDLVEYYLTKEASDAGVWVNSKKLPVFKNNRNPEIIKKHPYIIIFKYLKYDVILASETNKNNNSLQNNCVLLVIIKTEIIKIIL